MQQFTIRLEHLRNEANDLMQTLAPLLLRRIVYEEVGRGADRFSEDTEIETIKSRLKSIFTEREAILAYSPFMPTLYQPYQPHNNA